MDIDISRMRELVAVLRAVGYDSELHEPDGDDPLGGVIDISGEFGLVRIVKFGERSPAVIRDGLEGEDIRVRPDGALRIMPIPQLVALKLYPGGLKALADIVELLRRNPEVDLNMIGETCRKYRLRGWGRVLEELRQAPCSLHLPRARRPAFRAEDIVYLEEDFDRFRSGRRTSRGNGKHMFDAPADILEVGDENHHGGRPGGAMLHFDVRIFRD